MDIKKQLIHCIHNTYKVMKDTIIHISMNVDGVYLQCKVYTHHLTKQCRLSLYLSILKLVKYMLHENQ